jgi:hypothetical protein
MGECLVAVVPFLTVKRPNGSAIGLMIRLSSVSILTSAANCPVFTFARSNLKETLIGTLFINKPFADNKVNGDLFISAGILVMCFATPLILLKVAVPIDLVAGLYCVKTTLR